MARRLGVEEKQQLVAELRSSGMSLARFARERGLHPETLYRWRRALRGSEAREGFVEVRVNGAPAKSPMLVIEVAGRFRVEVPTDFEDEHLCRVLSALSSC